MATMKKKTVCDKINQMGISCTKKQQSPEKFWFKNNTVLEEMVLCFIFLEHLS